MSCNASVALMNRALETPLHCATEQENVWGRSDDVRDTHIWEGGVSPWATQCGEGRS